MSQKNLPPEFSPARKAASERASQADQLEGSLEHARNLLANYTNSVERVAVDAMMHRCEQAGEYLGTIYRAFDDKSASENPENLDFRPSKDEEDKFQIARTTLNEASDLVQKLQATAPTN